MVGAWVGKAARGLPFLSIALSSHISPRSVRSGDLPGLAIQSPDAWETNPSAVTMDESADVGHRKFWDLPQPLSHEPLRILGVVFRLNTG